MIRLFKVLTGVVTICALYAVFLVVAGTLFGILAVVATFTYHLLNGV